MTKKNSDSTSGVLRISWVRPFTQAEIDAEVALEAKRKEFRRQTWKQLKAEFGDK